MTPSRIARSLSLLLILFVLPAPVVRSSDGSLSCTIDHVDGAFVTGGYLALTGWAVDASRGTPVRKIEVLLDGKVFGESRRGGLRPDVLAHFERADYLWAGWSGTVSLKGVSAGSHLIESFAISSGGARVSCGKQAVRIKDAPRPPGKPAPWIAGQILLRTAALVAWLALVGLAPALVFRTSPILLSSPLIGLALFAIFSELGGAFHLRPLYSAAVLTLLSGAAGVILFRGRRRALRWNRTTAGTVALVAVFAVVGVIPLSAHGEGAVLGDIEDGIREATVADSIVRQGWRLPSDRYAYPYILRREVDAAYGRHGGAYLLAAVAQAFGVRAHEIHSVAMLASGCLVVLGTGLLAVRVLRPFPKRRWIAPALVALNSVLVATLYGQHLGNLLAAALFLLFLTQGLRLVRARWSGVFVLAVALPVAAGWTLYPEAMPLWGVTALFLSMVAITSRRRKRAVARFAAALVLSAVLNPVGLSLVARSWERLTRQPVLSTPYSRTLLGDTHYFPSPTVIAGITPYRLDAPAPVGRLRSVLIPVAAGLIVLVSLLGWSRLAAVEKRLCLSLVGPVVLALLANHHLEFPYGYAKFLVLAAPLWAITFVLLAFRAAGGNPLGPTWQGAAAAASLFLVVILSLASVRHVVNDARRWIPSWDPAFRTLPALARVAGEDAVFRVEDYLGARRWWMLYFLLENEVDLNPDPDPTRNVSYFQLVDRRRIPNDLLPDAAVASSRDFCIVPLAGSIRTGS